MLLKLRAAKPSIANLSAAVTMMAVMLAVVMLSGCASSAGSSTGTQRLGGSKIQACRSGDEMVSSSRQCLQDGAACYELTNGNWCTGERGNTCPAGSTQLPQGAACPRGARCITYGENLNCAIQFK